MSNEKHALKRYQEALGRGLSDHEAREEGWPTRHGKLGTLSCHEGCVTECPDFQITATNESIEADVMTGL